MDLMKEIEKYSNIFNSYIITNNISKVDIEISITNALYNKFLDKNSRFFTSILKKSTIFINHNSRYNVFFLFYDDFLECMRFDNNIDNQYYRNNPIEQFFNISYENFYLYLTIAILKRYYIPLISYNSWKKYYISDYMLI